jgi:hypothetical protein
VTSGARDPVGNLREGQTVRRVCARRCANDADCTMCCGAVCGACDIGTPGPGLKFTGAPIERLELPRDTERPENDLPPPQPQPTVHSYFLQLGREGYRAHTFARTVAFCDGVQCLLQRARALAACDRS